MAWRYPLYKIDDSYVIDNTAINENFLSVAEETAGYLNEHNFKAKTTPFIERTNLKQGASMKLWYRQPGTLPASNAPYIKWADPVVGTKTAGTVDISRTDGFSTSTASGMTITFTSRGGPTWICASFTLANTVSRLSTFDTSTPSLPDDGTGNEYYPLPRGKGFGFNCALQLDGVILNDSLVGTGDPGNEFYEEREQEIKDDGSGGGQFFIKLQPQGGGGLNGAWNAVVLDTVIDLSPGQHTVKIAIQDILSSNAKNYGEDNAYATKAYVTTRELFALELTR